MRKAKWTRIARESLVLNLAILLPRSQNNSQNKVTNKKKGETFPGAPPTLDVPLAMLRPHSPRPAELPSRIYRGEVNPV